jgi:hypothetical protein
VDKGEVGMWFTRFDGQVRGTSSTALLERAATSIRRLIGRAAGRSQRHWIGVRQGGIRLR